MERDEDRKRGGEKLEKLSRNHERSLWVNVKQFGTFLLLPRVSLSFTSRNNLRQNDVIQYLSSFNIFMKWQSNRLLWQTFSNLNKFQGNLINFLKAPAASFSKFANFQKL